MPAHASAAVPEHATGYAPGLYDLPGAELPSALDLDPSQGPYWRGMAGLLPQGLAPVAPAAHAPLPPDDLPQPAPGILYARLPVDSDDIGPFSAEADYRWIRVFPAYSGHRVQPAVEFVAPEMGWDGSAEGPPIQEPEPPGATESEGAPDAGAPEPAEEAP